MVRPLQGEGQRLQSRVVQHGQKSGVSLSKTEAKLTAKLAWEDLNQKAVISACRVSETIPTKRPWPLPTSPK